MGKNGTRKGKEALLVLVGRRILFLQPYGEAAALSVSMLP
jgi:hypothetical protein